MKISKLMNYSTNICQSCKGTRVITQGIQKAKKSWMLEMIKSYWRQYAPTILVDFFAISMSVVLHQCHKIQFQGAPSWPKMINNGEWPLGTALTAHHILH